MSDTEPNQAMPSKPATHGDGVEEPHGKTGGSESSGGGYPNPQDGSNSGEGGFFGHGGQSHIDYSGPGAEGEDGKSNDNAATGTQ